MNSINKIKHMIIQRKKPSYTENHMSLQTNRLSKSYNDAWKLENGNH